MLHKHSLSEAHQQPFSGGFQAGSLIELYFHQWEILGTESITKPHTQPLTGEFQAWDLPLKLSFCSSFYLSQVFPCLFPLFSFISVFTVSFFAHPLFSFFLFWVWNSVPCICQANALPLSHSPCSPFLFQSSLQSSFVHVGDAYMYLYYQILRLRNTIS